MKYIKNGQCYCWTDGQCNHHFAKIINANRQHYSEGHKVDYIHLMIHPNGYSDGWRLSSDSVPIEEFHYDSLIPEESFNEVYQDFLEYTHCDPINEEIYRRY